MYKGFTDTNGYHPEQVCVSRMNVTHVGINEENALPRTLRVWPNPSTDVISLHWPTNGTYAVEIFDPQGRIILVRSAVTSATLLDVARFASGWYTIQVRAITGERGFAKWMKP